MCLGIPGKIVSIDSIDPILRTGKVRFGGITKEVNLVYVPEAEAGDYVIVHVGFAISVIDEEEAQKTLEYLEQMAAELSELEAGGESAPVPPSTPDRQSS